MEIDKHYTNQRLARLYDIENGWGADRDFYFGLAGLHPMRILDLGCGTGALCNAYAAIGHSVTGVDPAQAMLNVAQQPKISKQVTWVQSLAQDFGGSGLFDLIVMTGHAFQVLQTDADIAATLATAKAHLAQNGRFVFETRNPAADWANRWHQSSFALMQNGQIISVSRRVMEQSDQFIRFSTDYRFDDTTLTSDSRLRFLAPDQIIERLQQAGLHCEQVYGDWDCSPFNPASSDEMIFVAQ